MACGNGCKADHWDYPKTIDHKAESCAACGAVLCTSREFSKDKMMILAHCSGCGYTWYEPMACDLEQPKEHVLCEKHYVVKSTVPVAFPVMGSVQISRRFGQLVLKVNHPYYVNDKDAEFLAEDVALVLGLLQHR